MSSVSIIKSYYTGREPLWKAYWLVWTVGSVAAIFLGILTFLFAAKFLNWNTARFVFFPVVVTLLIVFSVYSWIVVWRCAPNTKWPGWLYLSRTLVVTGIGIYLVLAAIGVSTLLEKPKEYDAGPLSPLAKEVQQLLQTMEVPVVSREVQSQFLVVFEKIYEMDHGVISPATNGIYGDAYKKAHKLALSGQPEFLRALMKASRGPYGRSAEGSEWINEMLWENFENQVQLTIDVLSQLDAEERNEIVQQQYMHPVHDGFNFKKIQVGIQDASVPENIKTEIKEILEFVTAHINGSKK